MGQKKQSKKKVDRGFSREYRGREDRQSQSARMPVSKWKKRGQAGKERPGKLALREEKKKIVLL